MPTLRGLATVEGVNGSATHPAILSGGALEVISGRVSHRADIQRRNDANGEWRGGRVRNQAFEFSITCYMRSEATTNRSDAVKATIFPVAYSVVTLSGFDEASGAGINGAYVYEQGAEIQFEDDFTKMTIPLVRPLHTTAASITAAVT